MNTDPGKAGLIRLRAFAVKFLLLWDQCLFRKKTAMGKNEMTELDSL